MRNVTSMRSLGRRGTLALVALAVMGAMAFGLSTASAQPPPPPPHAFYGDLENGSPATLDGKDIRSGGVVSALNVGGDIVGASPICQGVWFIQVDPGSATSVRFIISARGSYSEESVSFPWVSGEIEEVDLDLASVGQAKDGPPTDGLNCSSDPMGPPPGEVTP